MSEYEPGSCVIGAKPHRADGMYVCRGHVEKLGRILRGIEDEIVKDGIQLSGAVHDRADALGVKT